jgi:hypothetical protein
LGTASYADRPLGIALIAIGSLLTELPAVELQKKTLNVCFDRHRRHQHGVRLGYALRPF